MTTMLALIKAPGVPAQRFDLATSARAQLASMQSVVGGYVEQAVRGRGFVVWCNEEGKLAQPPLPINFHRPTDGDTIVGTVIVTGPIESTIDGGVPTALTEESATRIAALLDTWAAADILCGAEPAHYDPRDAADLANATKVAAKRRFAARVILADEMRRRGVFPKGDPS